MLTDAEKIAYYQSVVENPESSLEDVVNCSMRLFSLRRKVQLKSYQFGGNDNG
ncbi:hypothetical protein SEA_WEASELS2_267 [Rhodococcus phage Weasels2]|uniref:Uncharacterized protein n=1 Tax=Rhodococcus phage Weasels2 TaxID=1897437 RepID=A0A1I9SAN9_9CAUD|nr:hypothetical protein FDH04_gp149 [Rhodococcus phage Weasels2]AOZ63845.1 hypothetical protein SEA_WEASELS2_267 [Rhodococcus phage Weasels2]